MRITRTPVRNISQVTIDADVDFLDTYQVGSLATPAADEALRKSNKDITNAEVADAAAIAYAKLSLAGKLLMTDLATAIKNAANGIVVLDASADVPLAQIPDTLTGKDAATVGGASLATIEAIMDTKDVALVATNVLKAVKQTVNYDDASPVTVVTLPAGSIVIAVAVNITTIFAGTSPALDIGDATDPDGFLANPYITETTLGWYYSIGTSWGAYLYNATNKKDFKFYIAETAVLATIGGASLTQGVADVYIIYISME